MKSKRNVYLKMKTLAEAREILFDNFPQFGTMATENVLPPDAVGRVLSEPVFARISSPNFHAAAMDGVAVKAETTFGASEAEPKELVIGRDAVYVNTGHVLPDGTDAVIIVEKLNDVSDGRVTIEAPAFPWQNIRKMGEDIVATELLFPRNHTISAYDIGALINGGVFEVPVRRKPKVAIMPTGTEVVDWRNLSLTDFKPGQVLDANGYVAASLTEAWGGQCQRHDPISDDQSLIERTIRQSLDDGADIVLTVGGSSAGSEDYTKEVIASMGDILVHGVTIMPGKPVLIGKVDGRPVIGMPGYPVSMIVAFEQFVRPLIRRLLGVPEPKPPTIAVETTRKLPSKLGVEEFLRIKLGKVGDRFVATALPRGAGSITSITEADGVVRIPNHVEGVNDGETLQAELLKPLEAVEKTIVAVGSHDNTLDILADHLKLTDRGVSLSSSHVGSMGGLMAIKRGVCHIAGSHLLDTTDGSYNLSYVKRYLRDIPVRIVHLVVRDQGLIVAPGNPRNIRGIEDLTREDVRFINRQSGSGTRILLDYRLSQLGIDPDAVQGYAHEEFTHMSVAAAVVSGAADAGLGIFAAARALNLDFVPVVTEQYDLIIPEAHFDSENIRVLLEAIRTDDFKRRVEALGGYSTGRTGEFIL